MSIKVNNFMNLYWVLRRYFEHHQMFVNVKMQEDIMICIEPGFRPKYTTTVWGIFIPSDNLDSQRRTDIFRAIKQGISV